MDRAKAARARRGTRWGRAGVTGLALATALAVAAGAAWSARGAAQQIGPAVGSAPTSIPVVERFDPATGRRSRRTVAGLTTGEILSVQRALARAGRDPAVRSGALDRATRSALSAFQRDRGLPACGCPSYATVVALGLEPRVVETVVAARGRGPGFAHPTAGPADVVAGGGSSAGVAASGGPSGAPAEVGANGGPVSVSTEAGVVVVRGSGSGSADGRTGRMPARETGGAPGTAAAGPATPAGTASRPAWPGYGDYFEPLPGVWLLRGGRRHLRGGGPGGGEGGAGRGAHARPPIPYAPRLPEPRPAAPGLPPSLPPTPKSGGATPPSGR